MGVADFVRIRHSMQSDLEISIVSSKAKPAYLSVRPHLALLSTSGHTLAGAGWSEGALHFASLPRSTTRPSAKMASFDSGRSPKSARAAFNVSNGNLVRMQDIHWYLRLLQCLWHTLVDFVQADATRWGRFT